MQALAQSGWLMTVAEGFVLIADGMFNCCFLTGARRLGVYGCLDFAVRFGSLTQIQFLKA